MRLITLIENKSNPELIGKYGLAIYIKYNRKIHILDTGASNSFIDNVLKLDIVLSMVDIAVLRIVTMVVIMFFLI
ncbi:hypothetical protein ACLD43_16085 [Clostridium botulinum]|uniref:hypothetical protein n=1 Tax=Clostridium botulinum TaxID=1491 RepID=UPI003A801968